MRDQRLCPHSEPASSGIFQQYSQAAFTNIIVGRSQNPHAGVLHFDDSIDASGCPQIQRSDEPGSRDGIAVQRSYQKFVAGQRQLDILRSACIQNTEQDPPALFDPDWFTVAQHLAVDRADAVRDFNGVRSAYLLPSPSRPPSHPLSRITYSFPGSFIPLETSASTSSRIILSSTLRRKWFQGFHPIGGVIANCDGCAAALPSMEKIFDASQINCRSFNSSSRRTASGVSIASRVT